jgi:hypothetical protein
LALFKSSAGCAQLNAALLVKEGGIALRAGWQGADRVPLLLSESAPEGQGNAEIDRYHHRQQGDD